MISPGGDARAAPEGGFHWMAEVAERLLSERFGAQVSVVEGTRSPFSQIWRCVTTGQGTTVPRSVIVRVLRDDPARSHPGRLLNEQAALQLLASLGSTVAPAFLAADIEAGILISEDLGTYPSLLDLLLGHDAEAAHRGLEGFARALGSMHAKSIGYADLFENNRALLAAQHPQSRNLGPAAPLAEMWVRICAASTRLGLPPPRGVEGDIAGIESVLTAPGSFQALSSGDPSPVNCVVLGDSVRFFDFEEACFRHALLDARLLRYLYPTGGPVWRMPQYLGVRIERVYREALSTACPRALNDGVYELGMAAACAAWAIERLTRLPKVEVGPERDSWPLLPPGWSGPIPTRSRRRQLVDIMETCIWSLDRAAEFPGLAAWLRQMVEALTMRWPEAAESVPTYPAFE